MMRGRVLGRSTRVLLVYSRSDRSDRGAWPRRAPLEKDLSLHPHDTDGVDAAGPRTDRQACEDPLVAIIHFRDGKVAHEHIYWDQASVLIQLGVLDPVGLPVAGVQTARKVMDPGLPSNELMHRA